jgi:hypothetical protein
VADTAYPEHEKLAKVADESQAIGHFLDIGCPQLGLVLYERYEAICTCKQCSTHETKGVVGVHCEADRVEKGQAIYVRWRPAIKSIQAILAEYFGIDQDRLSEEKDTMLAVMRAQTEGGEVERGE